MSQPSPPPLPSPKECRRLRQARALSENEVAAQVGVTQETLRSWETGRRAPRGRKRAAYARVLDALARDPKHTPADAPTGDPLVHASASDPAAEQPSDKAPDNAAGGAPDPTGGTADDPPDEAPVSPPLPAEVPRTPAGAPAHAVEAAAADTAPAPPTPDGGDSPGLAAPQPVSAGAAVETTVGSTRDGGDSTAPDQPAALATAERPPHAPSLATRPFPERPFPERPLPPPPVVGPPAVEQSAADWEPWTVTADDDGPAPDMPEHPDPLTPAQAFDALYGFSAPLLVRQAYLLTGRRALAREAVERAFHLAWQRWPEVAVDGDPAGWVRAAAYDYALSPWHRLRPRTWRAEPPPATIEGRALLDALLALPPARRRALLLHEGLGIGVAETAAETEATTPATVNRLREARAAITARLPELADPEALRSALDALAHTERIQPTKVALVRPACERRTRWWTRAAIAFTSLIVGATALTLRTAPTHYEPPQAPAEPVQGVPPRLGPAPLTADTRRLRSELAEEPGNTPGRLAPAPY